ncbi:sulfate permease, SulP family [Actinobaculum suis]|uniref:SulP family inorganic anion transporter n=1 Tax=Actinobaculum suis TaxID=1657 RepID=A0A0K9EV39_9ACTO|nr:SulP family inorganic anion transporter [Actinobaculum suis]KMY23717.1 sulfate permease [Actinobaculum suis]MDY5153677.1 SulP family inorganic anion transporter [Actinobaculum suis]SDE21750.1 sulfate permease, SulP family [Actinobaculum suis]VDG75724.1 SulP family sulfate permease [Actinobaculum suis]
MPHKTRPTALDTIGSFKTAFSSGRTFITEVLAGLVVAFAMIPEALSFSIVAGVDPKVGLFASAAIAITIAFTGGRPAMMSGAAGSVALVIAPVMRDYGMDYLIATVLLGGLLQIIMGVAGVARLMRFIPRSVNIGFLNALAILIFSAQLPHLINVPWQVYPLVVAGVLIVWLLPKLTKAIPSSLVAIVVLTIFVVVTGIGVPTVGDMGELPSSWPTLLIPQVPLAWETLQIIFPYAFAMALVATMESLLTANIVDDATQTYSVKSRETWGQGIANLVAGLFGGIGGCGMVGQTVVGIQAGARTRLSTLVSGIFLLVLVVALGDITGLIPMAALVAVMLTVVVSTMDWNSLKPSTLRVMPFSETFIMLVTVILTVSTGNLAIGVIAGVVVAIIVFTHNVSQFTELERESTPEGTTYRIRGLLFFASSNDLFYSFAFNEDTSPVTVDLTGTVLWDASAVSTLHSIHEKYRKQGKTMRVTGLREGGRSQKMLNRLWGVD